MGGEDMEDRSHMTPSGVGTPVPQLNFRGGMMFSAARPRLNAGHRRVSADVLAVRLWFIQP
jgi:hypothetical protein